MPACTCQASAPCSGGSAARVAHAERVEAQGRRRSRDVVQTSPCSPNRFPLSGARAQEKPVDPRTRCPAHKSWSRSIGSVVCNLVGHFAVRPAVVIAQLMGHAKRHDAQRVHAGRRRFIAKGHRRGRIRIVRYCSQIGERRGRASRWARARLAEALSWFEVANGPPTRLTSLRRDSLRM